MKSNYVFLRLKKSKSVPTTNEMNHICPVKKEPTAVDAFVVVEQRIQPLKSGLHPKNPVTQMSFVPHGGTFPNGPIKNC